MYKERNSSFVFDSDTCSSCLKPSQGHKNDKWLLKPLREVTCWQHQDCKQLTSSADHSGKEKHSNSLDLREEKAVLAASVITPACCFGKGGVTISPSWVHSSTWHTCLQFLVQSKISKGGNRIITCWIEPYLCSWLEQRLEGETDGVKASRAVSFSKLQCGWRAVTQTSFQRCGKHFFKT